MPINPLYAKAMGSSEPREKNPAVKFTEVGDKVVGTILRVSDAFEAPNKFYQEGEPDWKRNKTVQAIDIQTADGKVTLWLNNSGMFAAIGEALMASDQSDLQVGWTLGYKWASVKTNPRGGFTKVWEARVIAPSE